MAKVGHENQGKLKAVIKFVSKSARTASAISSTNGNQRTRITHKIKSEKKLRNLEEFAQNIHMRGLFEELSNENPVWVQRREEAQKAKKQIRKLLKEMESETTGCLNFEKLLKVAKEPGTPNIRNLQKLKQTKCLRRKFEEVEETSIRNLDFFTSAQDPLICVKEEVVDECKEVTDIYDTLVENNIPKVTKKEEREEVINDQENVEQVEEEHEASNFINVHSIVYDHSYPHVSTNTQLTLQAVHSPMSKDQDQGNRGVEGNEPLLYEQENIINEYDDKITIEDDNLNKHVLEIIGKENRSGRRPRSR